jgi:hypothetical protein
MRTNLLGRRSWKRTVHSKPRRWGLCIVSKVLLFSPYSKKLTENEDLACLEGTLKLVDEVIVPRHWLSDTVRCTPCRLRCIGVARFDHNADSLESIGDNLTLRRPNDV